jgi:hypothetical protein
MTGKMFDSVTAGAIPAHAEIVGGYLDGLYKWSTAAWAMFPNAQKVGIVVKASSNMGQVLDVETGDATPADAPGWVQMRRADNQVRPTVYMNASTWPAVRTQFQTRHIPEPDYWVAQYDGNPAIPPGAVAKQYLGYPNGGSPGNYDVSSTDGIWPGIPPVPTPPPVETDVTKHVLFVGKNPAGTSATFESDGSTYRWLQTQADLDGFIFVAQTDFGYTPAYHDGGKPVALYAPFGCPRDHATAAFVGATFP